MHLGNTIPVAAQVGQVLVHGCGSVRLVGKDTKVVPVAGIHGMQSGTDGSLMALSVPDCIQSVQGLSNPYYFFL